MLAMLLAQSCAISWPRHQAGGWSGVPVFSPGTPCQTSRQRCGGFARAAFSCLGYLDTPSALGPFEVEFRALGTDGTVLVNGKINGDFGALAKTSMAIGTLPFLINNDGDYTFEWSFNKDRWDKIGILRIHHVPTGSVVSLPSE
jgi:hypothetical protein